MKTGFKIEYLDTDDSSIILYVQRTVDANSEKRYIKLTAVDDKIIRVAVSDKNSFIAPGNLMVLPFVPAGKFTVKKDKDNLLVSTLALTLEINCNTCAFHWLDAEGNTLIREIPNGGVTLDKYAVERDVFSDSAELKTIQTPDGAQVRLVGDKHTEVVRDAFRAKLELEFAENEAIYGLGQHEEGILNYRGHNQYLYQQNMKVAMPMIVSTAGYGILFDTCAFSTFHDDANGSYFWTECVDEFDYYFCFGPEFDDIITDYRRLTGRPVMLPKWAFGFIQSKERYKTQEELIEVAREYRKRKLPLDCIVQDWRYWPGEEWGWKTFDNERYPEPEKMCEQLHDIDVKLMISIWPHMRGGENRDLQMMKDEGLLLENQSTYDAFKQEGREMYWRHAYEGLFNKGVDAWWCDCTEPFKGDWQGAVKPEPYKRAELNVNAAKQWLDPGIINAYSLVHSQGIYEGQRADCPEKRVVNLTRSGYPGQQRYGTITWSGDVAANWETLRRQIADGLNFTVTGNPRWTMDIGAFFVKPRPLWFCNGDYPDSSKNPAYQELFVRWFQLGTFLPMFRCHGTDTPREIWNFGEPGSEFYETLKKFNELRYRLMPYIYSLAGMEYFENYTMFRMLAFDFRNDHRVYDVDDQFMFGPALMVCPVSKAMYYGLDGKALSDCPKCRNVYLPTGCDWYDFWTGEKYSGGQTISAAAEITQIPIFVRAGSIIPMGPVIQHVGENPEAMWELHIFPGADAEFTIYEDAGDGYEYENGEYSRYTIKWNDLESSGKITKRSGEFPGMCCERNLKIKVNNNLNTCLNYIGCETVF